jgi:uncharacterized protein (DUF305 family)
MIQHHQQAIQMSDIIFGKQGIDPRVVDLANQIKAAQGPEIQQMQGWLTQWGQPTPTTPSGSAAPTGTAAPGGTPAPSSGMMPSGTTMPGMGALPGMMSDQEITALQNAEGVEASKLFLTMMIHHHQGAIAMAQTEAKSGQNPPAIALAQSIVTTQQQQIDAMQSVLASL